MGVPPAKLHEKPAFTSRCAGFSTLSTWRWKVAEYSTDRILPAIVGDGVSGLYSAWRLMEAMPGSRIALFEGSERLGSRLLSLTPPDAPHLRAVCAV